MISERASKPQENMALTTAATTAKDCGIEWINYIGSKRSGRVTLVPFQQIPHSKPHPPQGPRGHATQHHAWAEFGPGVARRLRMSYYLRLHYLLFNFNGLQMKFRFYLFFPSIHFLFISY